MSNSGRKKYAECNFDTNQLHPQDKKVLEEYAEFRKQRALKRRKKP